MTEKELKEVNLGIAPIGWTNDDMNELGGDIPFERCIEEMRVAGFQYTEIGSKYPKDPYVLRDELNKKGLKIANCWFSTYFTNGNREQTIKDFKKKIYDLEILGAKVIGVSEQGNSIQGLNKPLFKNKPINTKKEWDLLFEGLFELANLAEKKNIKLTYHHHMGTGVQTESEIDFFMKNAPYNVYLLYDTGHLYYSEGKQDVLIRVLEKYFSKIKHIHLKDVRDKYVSIVKRDGLSFLDGVKMGVFTVPGDGNIDFNPIFKIMKEREYKGSIIVEAEQDPYKANPLKYAKMARTFILENLGI